MNSSVNSQGQGLNPSLRPSPPAMSPSDSKKTRFVFFPKSPHKKTKDPGLCQKSVLPMRQL